MRYSNDLRVRVIQVVEEWLLELVGQEPDLTLEEIQRRLLDDDGMPFAPWHGLAAHRPLGGIMRVRKAVYEEAKKFRAERNGRVIQEPHEMVPLGTDQERPSAP